MDGEHECTNSYGYKICVEEKVKIFACANYSKELCYDDKAVHEHIINNVDSSIK